MCLDPFYTMAFGPLRRGTILQRMRRPLYKLLSLTLAAALLPGCQETDIAPDAGPRPRKLEVVKPYGPDVGLRPGAESQLRVRYSWSGGGAVAGGAIRFAIFGDPRGSTLSADTATTDAAGEAVITVRAGAGASRFQVRASADGGAATIFYIEVSDRGFGSLSITGKYTGTLPRLQLVSVTYFLLKGGSCAGLDPLKPANVLRSRTVNGLDLPVLFTAISLGSDRALAGRAVTDKGKAAAAGCVEVPGSVLRADQQLSISVELRDLAPRTEGSYTLTSEITLPAGKAGAPTWPRPLAEAVMPWGDLADCKRDPAQAMLDCVVDALDPADPLDCVVAAPSSKAAAIQTERGVLAAGCRGSKNQRGTTSLEQLLHQRMTKQGKATLASLAKLEADTLSLLSHLKLETTLTLTALDSDGVAVARHEHVTLVVGKAVGPVSFKASLIGLPVWWAHPVKATVKSWHLTLASHALSLRLGLLGRKAMADAVLTPAKLPTSSSKLVEKLVGLVRATVSGANLAGCPALEHLVCTAARLGPGCLGKACGAGLTALASRLDAGFTRLDQHKAADLILAGEAPLTDSDGDLKVDSLGSAAAPGLWSAKLRLGDETVTPGEAKFTGKR